MRHVIRNETPAEPALEWRLELGVCGDLYLMGRVSGRSEEFSVLRITTEGSLVLVGHAHLPGLRVDAAGRIEVRK